MPTQAYGLEPSCGLTYSPSSARCSCCPPKSAKEKVAALAPSGLVLVMDEKGNELVVQNADKPFVPASVTKIVTSWLAMEVLRRRLDETYPPHWCRSSSGSLARVTVPSRAS